MDNSQKVFFDSGFAFSLQWEGLHVRIGSVRPESKSQISKSIKNLSQESIRNRFLGTKKEFSEKELNYLTQLDGWNHYAIGAEEDNETKKGIGIIRMVRSSSDVKEAEVAITLIDEYQKKGLGIILLQLIILAAHERNIERLSFTYLPQNEGIIRLMKKAGKLSSGASTRDYVQTFLTWDHNDLVRIKGQLQRFLPPIDNFHLEI